MNTLESTPSIQDQTVVANFFANVYKWMTLAMLVTAGVAWYVSQSESIIGLLTQSNLTLWGLFAVEIALVFYLSARAHSMAPAAAIGLFMLYSALNGVSLSGIFIFYASATIFKAFAVSAVMFATMGLFGYATKRDLSGLGSFFFMALIGLIVASIVNFWLASPMMEWVITYGGVLIFAGLTAYDHQKLKAWAQMGHDSTGVAINGALTLYLDFINMFLFLLRIFDRE